MGSDVDDAPRKFLGTGSLVGDGTILLTADHVISDWPNGRFLIVVHDATVMKSTVFPATIIERDPMHDMAFLKVTGYAAPRPLVLHFDAESAMNDTMMTYEYSTTKVSGNEILISPATRLGHVTRAFVQHLPGRNDPIVLIEMSWPALKGASGAPLMFSTDDERRFQVLGVIVANQEHHLSPSFIETILREDNSQLEQRLYMLPLGLAVDIRYIEDLYRQITAG